MALLVASGFEIRGARDRVRGRQCQEAHRLGYESTGKCTLIAEHSMYK